MHRHTLKLLVGVSAVLLGLTLLGLWAGNGPDFELQMVREVPTTIPLPQLQKAMGATINWPEWHFNTRQVQAIDLTGLAYPAKAQWIESGTLLIFSMEPPKKEWKRFLIRARIDEYVPGSRLRLSFIEETKGRIQKLLSDLNWTLEILPDPATGHHLIRGTVRASTLSARARIFGRLAPRILMNQVFYPDLEKLARLEFPKDAVPSDESPQEGNHP